MAEPGPGASFARQTRDPDPGGPRNPLSMLVSWALQFPFFGPGRKPSPPPPAKEEPQAGREVEKEPPPRPTVVSYPAASRPVVVPPLEVEAEESSGKTHNPIVIWQVYAIGGFIILKWILARWKERQERAKKADDDSQSPEEHQTPVDDEE